jgi:thiol-disulfide isomerase/thioredoxin
VCVGLSEAPRASPVIPTVPGYIEPIPTVSIVQKPLLPDPCETQPDKQRRRVAFGLAASLLSTMSTAIGGHAAAHEPDIPQFQSGRFQFTILEPRQALPSIVLFPLKGKAINLQSLRGQPVLLNFWASWCDACRTEMPILDRLQAREPHSGLQIIAVSEDRAERTVVERFLKKFAIQNLKIYLDPNGYVAFHEADNRRNAPFALYGMPITYAIAASGWIVGYMPGAADWTSPAAGTLIEFLHRS